MVNQIIKGSYLLLHNAALLAQDNANLRAANEKIVKKRNQSHRQIRCQERLTVKEGLQLAMQLNLLAEAPMVESHTQGELPI